MLFFGRKENTHMKSFIVALIFMLGLQSMNSQKPYDMGKNPHTAEPTSHNNATTDKSVPTDNANDPRAQLDSKTIYEGKTLNLGSMPCPPGDQECRTKEKERLAVSLQEHP
jgi:hypothetical protein